MMGLFGKKKDPKEQVRELQRKLRQETRTLDRQVHGIQREEQKVSLLFQCIIFNHHLNYEFLLFR